jgi:hypothetical protein
MPKWSKEDAMRHTKEAAKAPAKARAFGHAATSAAKQGLSEGAQVRVGNAAAKKAKAKK